MHSGVSQRLHATDDVITAAHGQRVYALVLLCFKKSLLYLMKPHLLAL